MSSQYPPPRKTNPWPWIGLGCAAVIASIVAFVAFVIFVVFGALRASEPYTASLQRAQRDPRAAAALGAPLKPGWFVSGNIDVKNREGTASLAIPLQGSKQRGTIHVEATKVRGRWTYQEMILTPYSGPEINLLTSSGGSPSTAPPGE